MQARKKVKYIINMVKRIFKDEDGQGLVEYALILVFIAIVVITSMQLMGGQVKQTYNNVTDELQGVKPL